MNSLPRGPRRPLPPTLTPARARVAAALGELGDDVLLVDLVERLGGHPNATRSHLEALEAEGLTVSRPRPRSGPGRPALGWSLTDAGRRALDGDPSVAAYAELVTVMAEHLEQFPDAAKQASTIGRNWGADKAAHPSRGEVVRILAELGFSPEVDPSGVRLRTCPILDAASEHPATVCAIHAGMVAGASGSERFRLLPFAEPGACRIIWT